MAGYKILIADDDQLIREMLKARLQSLGHQVVGEAADGEQAIEIALKEHPELIIMDIQMPVMDGLDAARQIVQQHSCAIVFLTGYNQEEFVSAASELGAFGYLMKPFRTDDLGPALLVAMKRYNEVQARQREVDELKEALETRKVIERAKGILMQRLGLTEEEAFKKIHFQARSQHKKMKEIADSIITAADLM
ncbi:MAG: ANTAR domain-containing response regulator [Armatimonadota bacterium]